VLTSSALFAGTPIVPQPKMGEPLVDLTAEQFARFIEGRERYITPLNPEDGLGPVFNKSSCGNCHNNPVGGTGAQTVTRFGTTNKGEFDPLDYLGGSLLQVSGISETCLEVVPKEATIVTPRVTNGALAYGLVESIDGQDLVDNRNAQAADVQGRIHWVSAFEDDPKTTPPLSHVGRFGWKAQVATVLTFSADAALNEMGLTNRFLQLENAPNGDEILLAACDSVPDPEDSADGEGFEFIERVTDFQRFLGAAPQTPRSQMTGETLFVQARCAECHTPSFTTKNDPNLEEALRNKVIRPYSDFMLHNMGEFGDPIDQDAGDPQFVKTPPLWGLRERDPVWHDGSIVDGVFSNRMLSAIARHGGNQSQGIASVNLFNAMTPEQQTLLIDFLFSLGRLEFDHDITLDNKIDVFDFFGVADCYTGAGVSYVTGSNPNPMDYPCAVSDIDQDGDVDLDDFQSFLLVFEGARRDCNGNGIIDLQDILVGAEIDLNLNGIPDSCEPTCDSDVNGTGAIDVDDLLAVINQWGNCPALTLPCSADINLDHAVNVDDLLAIINGWGACE
jgi:hypothetical protein